MVFAKKETTVAIPMIWLTANLQPWFASSFRRETVYLGTDAGKDTTLKINNAKNGSSVDVILMAGMFKLNWRVQSKLPQSKKVVPVVGHNFLSKTGPALSEMTAQQLCWQGFSEVLQPTLQVDLTPETAPS